MMMICSLSSRFPRNVNSSQFAVAFVLVFLPEAAEAEAVVVVVEVLRSSVSAQKKPSFFVLPTTTTTFDVPLLFKALKCFVWLQQSR